MDLLASYDTAQIAVAVLATLGAAFVRGLTGFGFGFLLTPILALALLPIQAVLLVNVLAFALALAEIRYVLREADRSALWISGLLVLTVPVGLAALAATPPSLARVLIALSACAAFVIVVWPRGAASTPGRAMTGATGLIAGLMTGFAAMPGISVVPYYVRQAMPRATAKASMIGIFGVSALASLATGAVTGRLDLRLLGLGALLFPMMVLGNWLGSLVFGRIEERTWRIWVALVLGGAAVAALSQL